MSRRETFEIAHGYHEAGLSIFPLGKHKTPSVRWKRAATEQFPWDDIGWQWWSFDRGIGIACGDGSGHLEVLDFDHDAKRVFRDLYKHSPDVAQIIRKMVIVTTPGAGFHLYFRCEEAEHNQVLARRIGIAKPLIETRGRGGYVAGPGGWTGSHPCNLPYVVRHGNLTAIPDLTGDERQLLFAACRSFDEVPVKKQAPRAPVINTGLLKRPGDDFNERASWVEILTPHGWTQIDAIHWCRPGKHGGISAIADDGGFFCFSTSVAEIVPGSQMSKFAVYAALNCDGDFGRAAQELSEQGYGHQMPSHADITRLIKERFENEDNDRTSGGPVHPEPPLADLQ